MKVKELIEELLKLDQEQEVLIPHHSFYTNAEVVEELWDNGDLEGYIVR